MKYDKFGQAYTTEDELCDILYKNPEQNLSGFKLSNEPSTINYNASNSKYYSLFEPIGTYIPIDYKEDVPIELFDWSQQQNWYMPDEYKTLDVAQWILDQCTTDPELQRVGEELLLYQERDLFNLLRYLKYFVDTMRKNNIVWGLGRGSSVASYVLYLIGVHKINSMYYDLDISEFLR
jgi:Bacterial DNA polymerase III alpha NTPase domain